MSSSRLDTTIANTHSIRYTRLASTDFAVRNGLVVNGTEPVRGTESARPARKNIVISRSWCAAINQAAAKGVDNANTTERTDFMDNYK